jgi:hypothetical protein
VVSIGTGSSASAGNGGNSAGFVTPVFAGSEAGFGGGGTFAAALERANQQPLHTRPKARASDAASLG